MTSLRPLCSVLACSCHCGADAITSSTDQPPIPCRAPTRPQWQKGSGMWGMVLGSPGTGASGALWTAGPGDRADRDGTHPPLCPHRPVHVKLLPGPLGWPLFISGLDLSGLQRRGNSVTGTCVHAKLLSRVRLCDPTDYNSPHSSVHGILQPE